MLLNTKKCYSILEVILKMLQKIISCYNITEYFKVLQNNAENITFISGTRFIVKKSKDFNFKFNLSNVWLRAYAITVSEKNCVFALS